MKWIRLLLILLLLPMVYSLQLFPQSITVTNQTQNFSFYTSEPVVFNSSCPNWFIYKSDVVSVAVADDAYSSCILYFSSHSGVETIGVPVAFGGNLTVAVSNESESIPLALPVLPKHEGVELLVEEREKESALGNFVGSIELPKFRLSTLGAILFVLFFVSVVFLLIPKT